MTLEGNAKREEKLACVLENDMRNLAYFHQSIQQSQNWDFHSDLFYIVENL